MKKIKMIIPALLIVLLALSGCEDNTSAVVFDHNAVLEGYVTFEDASPDSISALVAVSRDNIQLAETQTDENGFYKVENLTSGEYFVSVFRDGFARFMFQINLINNQTVIADTVYLESMATLEFATRTIDGNIDAGWQPVYTQDHDSSWGPNDFESLYMAYDDDYLYIAVSGEFSTSDNTVSIQIDSDASGDTGINDFSIIDGGDIGGRLRKTITAPDDFGADLAFNSGWALAGEGIVWLDNPSAVDEAMLEDVIISMNGAILEFAISLDELYGGIMPNSLSLVGYIGGGGDTYFANDTIPQGAGEFDGTFFEVFTIGF